MTEVSSAVQLRHDLLAAGMVGLHWWEIGLLMQHLVLQSLLLKGLSTLILMRLLSVVMNWISVTLLLGGVLVVVSSIRVTVIAMKILRLRCVIIAMISRSPHCLLVELNSIRILNNSLLWL